MSQLISIYKNTKDSKSQDTTTIQNFLHDVKTGKWKTEIEAVRLTGNGKELLPMVTLSGHFRERKADQLIVHSGYICIDIDNLKNEQEYQELFNRISSDKYTTAVFRSCRGKGIAVLIAIDPTRHADAFEGLEKYYSITFQVAIDRSCKDISRTRFVTYDPHLFEPFKPSIFKSYIPKKDRPKSLPAPVTTTSDFEQIIRHITTNHIDITNSEYDIWFRIGFALADEFAENGRDYFHSVSQFSEKYNPEITDTQYTNCLKSRGSGINISTFFYYCKNNNVPIRSPKTDKGLRIAEQAKKQGRTKDSAVRAMVELESIPPLDATEIADKAFAQPYTPERGGSPVETIEIFLQSNYQLRKNELTGRKENNGRPWTDADINSAFLDLKIIEPKIPQDLFRTYVQSTKITSFHPLREYLENNSQRTPIGTIKSLANTITGFNGHSPEGEYYPDYIEIFLTKFFLGLIAGALGDETPPIIPVLWGTEIGIGKTEFWKRLLPKELSQYFAISALDQAKDDDILLCQKWIVCDDEWGGMMSKNAKGMKNKAGASSFTLRKAYAHEHEDYKRVAMLCGTSNDSDIIADSSNRRIIPIHAQKIDLDA